MPLRQGRLDPYHRRAAAANPDLAADIEADIERLLERRRVLVLGDYSPKNLIVYPDHLLALDFEVAHWGDPSFDTGFMLTHLMAKALHRPDRVAELMAAASAFWHSYAETAAEAGAGEPETAGELAVLMLCRADGKSRLEYLTAQQRDTLRAVARRLVGGGVDRVATVYEAILEAVGHRGHT